MQIPTFNKAIDDRCSKTLWQKIKLKPDVIIFEGWCVGARAQTNGQLKKPVNSLEKVYDQDAKWRSYVNNQLKTETTDYTLVGDSVVVSTVSTNDVVIIQLVESARQENYGSYAYTKLDDIINNFLVAYVGDGKMILSAKRTDIVFFAKRAMQEFSYDTLQSTKSQELNIPPSLSVVIPQDYVNYVKASWIDSMGVKRPIYPANNLTINPGAMPLQDSSGVPTQDNFGENLEGTSVTEDRWDSANDNIVNGNLTPQLYNEQYDSLRWEESSMGYGQRYGMDPQYAQSNGWFTINDREGRISFSNDLKGKLVVVEYISDGNAYDLDARIPKMAEDALYSHVIHAILSTSSNVQEYVVRRFKQERSAKLRNAKIRLSNLKLDQIIQVMRGKSKWLKF